MKLWHFHIEDLVRMGTLGHRLYIMKAEDVLCQRYSIVTNMQFETMESGLFVPAEKATIDDSKFIVGIPPVKSFLQAASDAAWEIGIKPKQLEDQHNELKAVREHLADMKALVFKAYE